MAAYLYAVQDRNGREYLSATVDGVERFSDVTALRQHDSLTIVFDGDVEVAGPVSDPGGDLFFHRWPAENKLATPVTHPVR